MALTAVPVSVVDRTGTIAMPSLAAMDATNNNSVQNNGRVMIEVKNNTTTSQTLTIPLPSTTLPDTQPGADLSFTGGGVVYTLTNGQNLVLGPFPPQIYNNAAGQVQLNPQSTNLQILALQLN